MAFFPSKEEFIYLERDIVPYQHRIYPDACDFGIFEDEIDINKVREAVNELIKSYKDPEAYGYKAVSTQSFKEVSFYIPIEYDHDEGGYIGYKVVIFGCKGKGIPRPYISISLDHTKLPSKLKL
ncbi:MAG: hypothetical protein ACXWFB_05955 [Nitrososphaeraceae archaeon]